MCKQRLEKANVKYKEITQLKNVLDKWEKFRQGILSQIASLESETTFDDGEHREFKIRENKGRVTEALKEKTNELCKQEIDGLTTRFTNEMGMMGLGELT